MTPGGAYDCGVLTLEIRARMFDPMVKSGSIKIRRARVSIFTRVHLSVKVPRQIRIDRWYCT
jgi:hypothetical protein